MKDRYKTYSVSNSDHTITFSGAAPRRCIVGLITIASATVIYPPVAFGFTGDASGSGTITGVMVESNSLNISASGYTVTVPKQANNNYGRIALVFFTNVTQLNITVS